MKRKATPAGVFFTRSDHITTAVRGSSFRRMAISLGAGMT
jgi:hypothetical protein